MGVSAEDPKFLEDGGVSDDDVPEEAHKTLLNAVSQLYKKQRISAPKRREPAQEISEFNLTSNTEVQGNKIHVNELLNDLREKVTHKEINKKVKDAQKTSTTLPKPLEKNEAEKIHRAVGYENVKKNLDKWSTIVERNRLASTLTFPLQQKPMQKEPPNFLTTFDKQSDLEKAMAEVLKQSEVAQEERKLEDELSKLSVEEMIERRNMMAKMKARESYKIAKAVRQNKIKSKKYHRILKKERIKQELANFEKLQKTDPEAALQKLEQIERARAEERISLRHRNTGKWARSRAIRAKYDTEARVQLAEQLAKSRDLTRKIRTNNSSDSEGEGDDEEPEVSEAPSTTTGTDPAVPGSGNPWMDEYTKFLKGFQNFSQENQEKTETTELKVANNNLSEDHLSPVKSSDEKNTDIDVQNTESSPVEDNILLEGPAVESKESLANNVTSIESTTPSVSKTHDTSDFNKSSTKTTELADQVSEDHAPADPIIEHPETCNENIQSLEPSLEGTNEYKARINNNSRRTPRKFKSPTKETEPIVKNILQEKPLSDEPQMPSLNQNLIFQEKLTSEERISPNKSPCEETILNKECLDSGYKNKQIISNNVSSPTTFLSNSQKKRKKVQQSGSTKRNRNSIEADNDISDDKVSMESGVQMSPDTSKNLETVLTNSGTWSVERSDGKKVKKPRKLTRQKKEKSLNDLFDDAEEVIQTYTKNALGFIKADLENDVDGTDEKEARGRKDEQPPKKQIRRSGLDEALIEVHECGISSGANDLKELKDKLLKATPAAEKEPQIDPNKHLNVKTQKLFSEIGDIVEEADTSDDEQNNQKMHLMEAFADDDIAEEFSKEKENEAKKNQAEEINLQMPGWGSWGGTNIAPKSKRRQRRRFIRLEKVPRKDEKKPTVIINEDPVPKLREKLVNELPYPFRSVKDYEASIRVPLGKNWVPEQAFKKLTVPPVRSRMGTIIEPISDELAQIKRGKRRKKMS